MTTAETATVEGRITDEDIERAKAQIGIPVHQFDRPWNRLTNSEQSAISPSAAATIIPLFHDPTYGAGPLARTDCPTDLPIATGLDQTPQFTDPERKKLFRGLFRGTGKYYAGVKWTWVPTDLRRAGCPGRELHLDVAVKESEFSGGRSVKETIPPSLRRHRRNPIATRDESYINAERHGSKKSGKYLPISNAVLTEEEFADVEAPTKRNCAGASRGGARTSLSVTNYQRWMKGPLTVVDITQHAHGLGLGRLRRRPA